MKINEGLLNCDARAVNSLLIQCSSHKMDKMNTIGGHTKPGVLLLAVRLQKGS
jgi:hypothetical protein